MSYHASVGAKLRKDNPRIHGDEHELASELGDGVRITHVYTGMRSPSESAARSAQG